MTSFTALRRSSNLDSKQTSRPRQHKIVQQHLHHDAGCFVWIAVTSGCFSDRDPGYFQLYSCDETEHVVHIKKRAECLRSWLSHYVQVGCQFQNN